jgi:tetratricopeptide (TPR) repeat protein
VLDNAASTGWPALPPMLCAGTCRQNLFRAQAEKQVAMDLYLLRSLRAYRAARNSCPLLDEPHQLLAQHIALMRTVDTRADYLRRAKTVAPGSPLVWFTVGREEFALERDAALATWRRCLELDLPGTKYLRPILDEIKHETTPLDILQRLLPEDARLNLETAMYLYPDSGDLEADRVARTPFLERGLQALASRSASLLAADLELQALLFRYLGRADAAVLAYAEAVLREPRDTRLRFQYASYLAAQEHNQKAYEQLRAILLDQPRNAEALALFQRVGLKRAQTFK